MEELCFRSIANHQQLVNQSSQVMGVSSCAFDIFLNPERVQDVQGKFAYEIVATSNCRLLPRFDPRAGACTRGALTI
jgi:hypothetical protein